MPGATEHFTINDVYPWGRTFDEYVVMFALTDDDLRRHILGCADGPAAFNADLTRRGGRIVSCDPLYRFTPAEIRSRVESTRDLMVSQVLKNSARFRWDRISSPGALGELRMSAMSSFLTDFDRGLDKGRYLDASLPFLPFADGHFDLALCSHLLFLYSDRLSCEFHLASTRELTRVAAEVRIFPVVTLEGRPSPFVDPVIEALTREGFLATIEAVPYEFLIGGNQMLRIRQQGGSPAKTDRLRLA